MFYNNGTVKKSSAKKLKLFVFYPVATIIFVVLAAYILLIAFGYTLHIKDGKITTTKTGIIIIATSPGDASVYINNELYQRRTPSLPIFSDLKLNHLPAADYNIRIQKDGYIPWEGIVTVRPGYVSWLNYVLLVPKEINPEKFNLPGSVVSAIESSDRSAFLVTSVDLEQKIQTKWHINSGSKEKTKIYESSFVDAPTVSPFLISFNNDRYLYKETVGEKENIIVREMRANGRSWNVTSQFGIDFESLHFSPHSRDKLYAFRDSNLYSINFLERTMSASLASDVVGVYSNRNEVLLVKVVDENHGLWRISEGGSLENIIKALPSSDGYRVTRIKENHYLVFVGEEKELMHYKDEGEGSVLITLSRGVDFYQLSGDSTRVAIKAEEKLRTYDFDNEIFYDVTTNKDIEKINWLVGNSNIMFSAGEEIRFVNFNGFYNNLIAKTNSKVFFSTSSFGNNIYFTKKSDEGVVDLYVVSL